MEAEPRRRAEHPREVELGRVDRTREELERPAFRRVVGQQPLRGLDEPVARGSSRGAQAWAYPVELQRVAERTPKRLRKHLLDAERVRLRPRGEVPHDEVLREVSVGGARPV